MNNKTLCIVWACLFIFCAGLGFIPESQGFGTVLLVAVSVLFFLPGGMLLYRAHKAADRKLICRIRWISAASLGLTFLLLLANFLCINASRAVGDFLYGLLVIVSAPMCCGRYWIVSLFLWACLLMATFTKKEVSAN